MTCIVADPSRPERIWAGAASGGVWFSPDAGRSWELRWNGPRTLNVGSLALAQHDGGRWLYCGTGEANLVFDSYPGLGLYRSGDEGATWEHFASTSDHDIPSRIGTIAIDPDDPQHVRIGGIPNNPAIENRSSIGGMYVTRDGGANWRRELFYSRDLHYCHQVLFNPNDSAVLYACFSSGTAQAAVWRSQDNGASWQGLTSGLPHASEMGRTSLTICQSAPNVLYLLVADRDERVRGIYRSLDRGDSWQLAASHTGHYKPSKAKKTYRLIVLRKRIHVTQGQLSLEEEVRYFFYVTNIPAKQMKPAAVVRENNARCHQENLIEQLKNGVQATRMPVAEFNANWAYLVIGALAWNLKAWTALILPKSLGAMDLLKMEFRRFLDEIILIPAQILRKGRRLIFRLLQVNSRTPLLVGGVAFLKRRRWA